jgi:hypothetical protein
MTPLSLSKTFPTCTCSLQREAQFIHSVNGHENPVLSLTALIPRRLTQFWAEIIVKTLLDMERLKTGSHDQSFTLMILFMTTES